MKYWCQAVPMTVGPPARPELAAAIARVGSTGVVARAVGCGETTLSAIARGLYLPSMELRQRIADFFHTTVDELFSPHPDILRLMHQRVEQGLSPHIEDPMVWKQLV